MGQARQEALPRARRGATGRTSQGRRSDFKAMLEVALEGRAKGTWQLHARQQWKAYKNCWLLETPPKWRAPLRCPCAPRLLHVAVPLHHARSLASWSLPGKAPAPRCSSPLSTFFLSPAPSCSLPSARGDQLSFTSQQAASHPSFGAPFTFLPSPFPSFPSTPLLFRTLSGMVCSQIGRAHV